MKVGKWTYDLTTGENGIIVGGLALSVFLFVAIGIMRFPPYGIPIVILGALALVRLIWSLCKAIRAYEDSEQYVKDEAEFALREARESARTQARRVAVRKAADAKLRSEGLK